MGGDFASLALKVGRKKAQHGSRKAADIISFIEASWGLGMRLFPVQRVILKAHYGLALDDNPYGFPLEEPIPEDHPQYDPKLVDRDGYYVHRIAISDWRRENERVYTEAGYLKYLYDTGRSNIKEVIPGVERRELILPIGRRSGKCLKAGSLVLTSKGVVPIESLGDPDGPEYQPCQIRVAQEGRGTTAESAFFYNGGLREIRDLRTHCGFHLGGTPNHRIKVMSPEGSVVWKFLEDIEVGDFVAIHRGTELWPPDYLPVSNFWSDKGRKEVVLPTHLTEDWGLLLGALVGGGSWKKDQVVELTVACPDFRSEMHDLWDRLFGSHKEQSVKHSPVTTRVQFFSQSTRQFLHDIGWVTNSDRRSKRVPWSIMQSPAPVVCSFLRGLFETDGGMESHGKVVSFCSASERLAHEVQTLLLNLGIVSRVRVKWNKTHKRDYYTLTIRGFRHRRIFAERVGFVSRRKLELLWAGLKTAGREGGNAESLPHLRDWAARLLASVKANTPGQGWSRSDLRMVLGNTIKPNTKDQMTYPRLEKALGEARRLGADPVIIDHLQALYDLDYFYDPVVSVEQGAEHVYDLSVPEGAMFVANGLTNHNTLLSSCIAAYETYKLITLGHPQGYYGLPDSNVIQIISIATDKDQAGLLYREVHGHFVGCPMFAGYMANATQSFATFQTPRDIEKFGSYAENPKARFSIKVTFRSCVARGLRGAGNIVVILDEVAHFVEDGQSGAEEIYNAVTPSTSAFSPKDPGDTRVPIGSVEGRVVLISSPLGKQGQFYKLFQIGMRGGRAAENMLCIQAPTWEVNLTIPAHEFEKHYAKDPRVFFTEYGGEFTDRTRGWIEDETDLLACINPQARPKLRAPPRVPHFLGLDVALVGDPTALAIGHNDGEKVVLDLVDTIKAGEGEYRDKERLEFDDVADWVEDYCSRFYISKGMFDRWAGIPMEQSLSKRGLKQLESVHHTRTLNSQLYQNLKDMMLDRRLVLYDWPITEGQNHCSYIEELLELQAEMISKYIILVAAPDLEGKHDDQADAIARMVWLATNHNSKVLSLGVIGRGRQQPRSLLPPIQARRKALLGGSHSSRQPRSPRGNSMVLDYLKNKTRGGRR